MKHFIPTNPPTHIYLNRINNRLLFKVKDGYKLELQTPGTMKQLRSNVLYTFTPNKSYAYLLIIKSNNLLFLETYNTEFADIVITITNQNNIPLEIEEKVNLTLLIDKWK